jgi:endonuclease YncB( thermonuclease family)
VVRVRGRDRYGRTIGDVFLPDGRHLNQELVRAGYAWWYRRYSADQRLAALEGEARAARRGLWTDPNPQPPWEWRKGRTRTEAQKAGIPWQDEARRFPDLSRWRMVPPSPGGGTR